MCQFFRVHFHELEKHFVRGWYKYISCSTNNFYTIRCPFHAPRAKFKIALQSSLCRLTIRCDFYKFYNITKKRIIILKTSWHLIIDQFYLLISLEGVQSIIESFSHFTWKNGVFHSSVLRTTELLVNTCVEMS